MVNKYHQPQTSKVSTHIKWDEQDQLVSSTFNDVYFSKINGLEESRYVFLEGNNLPQRFKRLQPYQDFCVAETGFGTGLNFLSCWQCWQQQACKNAHLTYISIEKYPLYAEEMNKALSVWPELQQLKDELVSKYAQSVAINKAEIANPFYTLQFGNVRLILIIDSVEDALNSLFHSSLSSPFPISSSNLKAPISKTWDGIDAWFLDGFTPSRNPDMWTQTLFNSMVEHSHHSTTLATFTAATQVRKGLYHAGFAIEKAKGFGKKREMLTGRIRLLDENTETTRTTNSTHKKTHENTKENKILGLQTPWHINRFYKKAKPSNSIAIIGGGLAGCHSAYALAKRGFRVTLIESQNDIASEASGNLQGVVYGKLSAHLQKLSEFNLHALLFAQQHYAEYWQTKTASGKACGVLQLSYSDRLAEQHELIANQFRDSTFLQYINAKEASNIAGIAIPNPALYFPKLGWLNPKQLCHWLTQCDRITKVCNTRITSLKKVKESWLLKGDQELDIEKAEWEETFTHVIIANANAAKQFTQTQWVPTKPIRGQVSYIDSNSITANLKSVVCAKGYIAPKLMLENHQRHIIGASYNLHNLSNTLSQVDHTDNVKYLETMLRLKPEQTKAIEIKGGRVGFRCTSPDYLPLVGPVPDYDAFQDDYAELSHNAKLIIPKTGQYHQGLYLNIAHGSRGLAYTPIAAEILASSISGQAQPLAQNMVKDLNPGRFIIRNIRRTNKH